MDEFTYSLAQVALDELQERVSITKIEAGHLVGHTTMVWVQWRDALLDMWAEQLLEVLTDDQAHTLAYGIRIMLSDFREVWEYPDPELILEWVAYGLACLRWLYWLDAPQVAISRDEARELIAQRLPPQQLTLPGFAA